MLLAIGCKNAANNSKNVKLYSASQLYNNEELYGVAFNPDETKVLVNSDRTGIQNLYELNISDTSMRPLTHSTKESFYGVGYLPGTENYLYSADQGGNENDDIFLKKPGQDSAMNLTPWPGTKNQFKNWSDDKKSIFILSNRRDPKFFDIWKADTANWKFSMFYKNDSAYDVGAISKDERFIALTKNISTDKNELYLLDRTNNKMKRISNDNQATWNVTAFEKGDSVMYYITNEVMSLITS